MKKYILILPFILAAMLFSTGCQESTQKDIVGIWEVYDCDDIKAIGMKFYFYEDGRFLLKDPIGLASYPMLYKIEKGEILLFESKDKDKENLKDSSYVNIKDDKFLFKSLQTGYLMNMDNVKLKKVSDL